MPAGADPAVNMLLQVCMSREWLQCASNSISIALVYLTENRMPRRASNSISVAPPERQAATQPTQFVAVQQASHAYSSALGCSVVGPARHSFSQQQQQ